ncbi:MAG TPA: hypothetical protein PLL76_08155 [Thermoanaerobaculia bacterium]|nr:hypothetical protein [Thermoanaerobaculia bacterium]
MSEIVNPKAPGYAGYPLRDLVVAGDPPGVVRLSLVGQEDVLADDGSGEAFLQRCPAGDRDGNLDWNLALRRRQRDQVLLQVDGLPLQAEQVPAAKASLNADHEEGLRGPKTVVVVADGGTVRRPTSPEAPGNAAEVGARHDGSLGTLLRDVRPKRIFVVECCQELALLLGAHLKPELRLLQVRELLPNREGGDLFAPHRLAKESSDHLDVAVDRPSGLSSDSLVADEIVDDGGADPVERQVSDGRDDDRVEPVPVRVHAARLLPLRDDVEVHLDELSEGGDRSPDESLQVLLPVSREFFQCLVVGLELLRFPTPDLGLGPRDDHLEVGRLRLGIPPKARISAAPYSRTAAPATTNCVSRYFGSGFGLLKLKLGLCAAIS